MENATYEIRAGGIALVTIDMKGSPVNAMNDAFSAMLDEVLGRLDADKDSIAGVILTSAKSVFVAGGDVAKILELRSQGPEAGYAFVQGLKAQLRRSEEHTSELQSLMRTTYAVFCLKKKKQADIHTQ